MLQLVTVDFDGTLFQGDSFKLMFQAGTKKFSIRGWSTVLSGSISALYLRATNGKDAFRSKFFKSFAETFKGKTKEELNNFFQLLIEMGKDQINQQLVDQILYHQKSGHQVIILSGALQPFLDALTRRLRLDVITIGTELKYDENGICTGETSHLLNGDLKVKAVTDWLKNEQIHLDEVEMWAYADSESDIPLLRFVQHPILVNPKNDAIREIAKENHWPLFGGS